MQRSCSFLSLQRTRLRNGFTGTVLLWWPTRLFSTPAPPQPQAFPQQGAEGWGSPGGRRRRPLRASSRRSPQGPVAPGEPQTPGCPHLKPQSRPHSGTTGFQRNPVKSGDFCICLRLPPFITAALTCGTLRHDPHPQPPRGPPPSSQHGHSARGHAGLGQGLGRALHPEGGAGEPRCVDMLYFLLGLDPGVDLLAHLVTVCNTMRSC